MTMVLRVNFIDHGKNYHGSKNQGLLSKLSGPTWSYQMQTLIINRTHSKKAATNKYLLLILVFSIVNKS